MTLGQLLFELRATQKGNGRTDGRTFFGGLRYTDTVKVIPRRFSFTGGGRPQVPFRALFQARTGT
jgi:hypothetical protein